MTKELISRGAARERGLVRYFTGKPCKHGHVAERTVSNGECVVCAAVRTALWRKTPQGRAYKRQYGKTPKVREWQRKYDSTEERRTRRNILRRKHRLERKQGSP
jgi:hypothetical protein